MIPPHAEQMDLMTAFICYPLHRNRKRIIDCDTGRALQIQHVIASIVKLASDLNRDVVSKLRRSGNHLNVQWRRGEDEMWLS
jgi:hypothetical protein